MIETLYDKLIALSKCKACPPLAAACKLLNLHGSDLEQLYKAADHVRCNHVGDDIHVRGIIDMSSHCRRNCLYCGRRAENPNARRYRMTVGEVLNLAHQAVHYGCGSVIIRSGEDPEIDSGKLGEIVRRARLIGGLAVTLSLGERSQAEMMEYRRLGCNRYLLPFETSSPALFAELHPDGNFDKRIDCVIGARAAGMQLGSGFLIGLPNQNLECIAADILFTTSLKLDMIFCAPFVPHPDTPLADRTLFSDPEVYFKTLALLRILNPYAHITAPNSFGFVLKEGRNLCLKRGCNVFTPDLTPPRYRDIYPLFRRDKGLPEDIEHTAQMALRHMRLLGRTVAQGPGHSLHPDWHGEGGSRS